MNKKKTSGFLKRIFLLILIPNLFFWFFRKDYFYDRAFVNVDYFAIAFSSYYLRRYLFLFLFSLCFLADVLTALGHFYHLHPAEIIYLIKYFYIFKTLTLSLVLFLIFIFVFYFLIFRVKKTKEQNHSKIPFAFLLLACLFSLLDWVNGTTIFSRADNVHYKVNLGGSPAFGIISAIVSGVAQKAKFEGLTSDQFASSQIWGKRSENIVLVLVESLGEFQDPSLNSNLFNIFLAPLIQQRFKIYEGRIPFTGGSTIHGEIRELCAKKLTGIHISSIDFECLPKYYKMKGFDTYSLHGFTGQFYDRDVWHKLLGFEKEIYLEDFKPLNYKLCGIAFQGVCDFEIAHHLLNLLNEKTEKKKFIYWLTLNSHLPLSSDIKSERESVCSQNENISRYPQICALYSVLDALFQSISEVLKDPSLPPTDFLIVGDHPPPFTNSNITAKFTNSIPWIYLEYRN